MLVLLLGLWGSYESNIFREIEFGAVASEPQGGFVVGSGGGFGGVEGAEPDSCGFVRVSNLCSPFAPWPLPHSPVSPPSLPGLFVGYTTLCRSLGGRGCSGGWWCCCNGGWFFCY